ncbi:MAG: thiol protease/hemagglutinin PrtT [Candidatus Limisoma sp.]
MKKLLLLASALLISTCVFAKQISEAEALSLASKYVDIEIGHTPFKTLKSASKRQAKNAEYYMFNSDKGGFVIISGDDSLTELIGYSDSGAIDEDNMPTNMKAWLDQYAEYVNAVRSGEAEPTKITARLTSTGSVSPMITTKWDQGTPYNNLAPTLSSGSHCATGCAATALAQIMNYYEWPAKGLGSHSYTSSTNSYSLSSNFASHTYDWANMRDEYTNSNWTTAQASAVAQLMYDCGVAMDMDYGDSSGATNGGILTAATTYFNYNSQIIMRGGCTTATFQQTIIDNLNEGKPLLFTGQGIGGGHAFVVDGYAVSGYLHVNWGWSGVSDGYFNVNYMNPSALGTGGGTGGFNFGQSIIIIEPNRTSEAATVTELPMTYESIALASSITSTSQSPSFTVTNCFNQNGTKYTGQICVALINSNNQLVANSTVKSLDLDPGYGYSKLSFSGMSLSGLASGTYYAIPISKKDSEQYWQTCEGSLDFVQIKINGTSVSIANPAPVLYIDSEIETEANMMLDYATKFVIPLSNYGSLPASGTLNIAIKKAGTTVTTGTVENVIVYDSADCNVEASLKFPSSSFQTGVEYELAVTGFTLDDGTTIAVTQNSAACKFTFGSKYSVPTNALTFYNKGDNLHGISLDVPYFAKDECPDIIFTYIQNPWSESWTGYIGVGVYSGDNLLLDSNGYGVTLATSVYYRATAFQNMMPDLSTLSDGTYYVHPLSNRVVNSATTGWIKFAYDSTIKLIVKGDIVYLNELSGVNDITTDKVAIFPNPATDYVRVTTADDVESISIYSLNGSLVRKVDNTDEVDVADLNKGCYLISIKTANETIRSKFFKK